MLQPYSVSVERCCRLTGQHSIVQGQVTSFTAEMHHAHCRHDRLRKMDKVSIQMLSISHKSCTVQRGIST